MWFFLGLWALLATATGTASAHPMFSPARSNRYLKLSLTGGGVVRVAYSVFIGEKPATGVREKADLNHDGTLDEKEEQRFADGVRAAVDQGLSLSVDGVPRKVHWEQVLPGFSDPRLGPYAFSVDLFGTVRAHGPGPHLVKVDDHTPLADLGESEIDIEEGPGTRVLTAWRGREDKGRVLRQVYYGPRYSVLEDRSVGFRFVDARPAPGGSRTLLWAMCAVAVALLAGGGLFLQTRYRRRSAA